MSYFACLSNPLEVHIFWTHTVEYHHGLSLRIVSVEMFENIYPRVEWRPKPFRLQRSLNSVYRVNLKYAKVRTGSHLRNSQSVERSFSGPRTYLRAGWNRPKREKAMICINRLNGNTCFKQSGLDN